MPPVRQIRDLRGQGHQIREKPLVGIGLRRSRSGTQKLHALTGIAYTATLDVGRETAETLARFLREHRERLGTRKGTRSLGVFKQGVLVLRWFVDGTRLAQLARNNGVSVPTAYRATCTRG